MVEILVSNDPVLLSWAEAMLRAEGIDCVLFDAFTSGIEGGIGAFPRRLMVLDEDRDVARRLLESARPDWPGS